MEQRRTSLRKKKKKGRHFLFSHRVLCFENTCCPLFYDTKKSLKKKKVQNRTDFSEGRWKEFEYYCLELLN